AVEPELLGDESGGRGGGSAGPDADVEARRQRVHDAAAVLRPDFQLELVRVAATPRAPRPVVVAREPNRSSEDRSCVDVPDSLQDGFSSPWPPRPAERTCLERAPSRRETPRSRRGSRAS